MHLCRQKSGVDSESEQKGCDDAKCNRSKLLKMATGHVPYDELARMFIMQQTLRWSPDIELEFVPMFRIQKSVAQCFASALKLRYEPFVVLIKLNSTTPH